VWWCGEITKKQPSPGGMEKGGLAVGQSYVKADSGIGLIDYKNLVD